MKITNIALSLALIGTLSLGMAEETTASAETTTTTETTVSVDTEIAEIQAAPAQERVKLMNQFKQKLANMNEADRAAAIEQLQTSMQATRAQGDGSMGSMTQTRTRTQAHAQEMQMQTNEQMIQMQNMNQNRVGNQFNTMHGNTQGGAATGGASFNMNTMRR